MLSTEEQGMRSILMISSGLMLAQCNAEQPDIPGEQGRPQMTGTVVRLCCAKLPAQVLLSRVVVCTCSCSNCPCSQR